MDHVSFVHLLRRASCVITDSGGVIEEAVTLGIPTLILREHTERVEALIDARAFVNLITLDGMKDLPAHVETAIARGGYHVSVFGKGDAAQQISDIIVDKCRKTNS